jgi:FkbM family methyltransferase
MKLIKDFLSKILFSIGYELVKIRSDENLFYKDLVKKDNPTIFDVGANQGQSIDRFRKIFPNALMHSFEPTSELIEILEKKYFNSKTKIVPYAVSDKLANVNLNVYDTVEKGVGNSLHNLNKKYPARFLREEKIRSITLESYAKEAKLTEIDILKIDVQGHEIQVLNGAKKLLSENSIKIIELEMMFDNTYDVYVPFFEIEKILNPCGYRLYCFSSVRNRKNGKLSWVDAVYVSRDIYNNNLFEGR